MNEETNMFLEALRNMRERGVQMPPERIAADDSTWTINAVPREAVATLATREVAETVEYGPGEHPIWPFVEKGSVILHTIGENYHFLSIEEKCAFVDELGLTSDVKNMVNCFAVANENNEKMLVFTYKPNSREGSIATAKTTEEFERLSDWSINTDSFDNIVAAPRSLLRSCAYCCNVTFPHDSHEVNGTVLCAHCHEHTAECAICGRRSDTEDMDEVYDADGDRYIGTCCRTCVDNECWYDEDCEFYRLNTNRNNRRSDMQKYLNPEGVLANKNIIYNCADCQESEDGICVRHMKQKAIEMEKERTTLWVYDSKRRNYHEPDHRRFKQLKYTVKHENPYLFYGVELEWLFNSNISNRDKIVKEIIEASGGLCVAEYDRSVDELGNGTEFIFRPISYKAWLSDEVRNKFKAMEKVAHKWGILEPQPAGCGMHVHMSRKFFEKNTKKQVAEIKSDMDWFFHFYQKEFERISKRKYTQYCTSKPMRVKDTLKQTLKESHIKGTLTIEKGQLLQSAGSGWTHHECINETPATIEARTFLSMTKYEDVVAIIEFCRALAHAARNSENLVGKTLGEILYMKDSKFLQPYLENIKGLKLNRKFDTKMEAKL